MLSGPPPAARLHVLGGARLVTGAGRDATPKSAKARALLALLALSPGGGADRAKLSGLLWSESAEAKTSLRQCIKELRRTLADAGLPQVVAADKYRVALDLSSLWVDALEVERLARSSDRTDLEEMVALYTGDLLESVPVRDPEFDEWLVVERARLRQQVCRALETALRRGLEERDLERLGRAAEALLALDPAHEEAHRALMRGHGLRGDLPAAIRQYQACRDALARELDVAPSAETEALLREIRSGALRREAPTSPAPPVGSPPAVPTRGPPHASIAVEHKAPATGDPADEAVAAALAASLREALSRNRWLSVVDPGPALLVGASGPRGASGGGPRPTMEPRYRVGIGVLRVRDRVRFFAELNDATTGRILWSEHFDRALGEGVFDVVDELAAALARRLDREVELAEIIRASRKPVEALSAYDCVLRAIPLIFELTPESFAQAERLLLQAQATDPHDPLVYAWRAFWYFLHIGQGWAKDIETARAELGWLVRRAMELDPKNALALAVAGHIASFVNHDYDRALGLLDQSLRLDPNSAYVWDLSALTLCYTGNAEEGLRRLEGSRDLWQRHPNPSYFRTSACIALMLAGRYDRAIELSRRTIRENPNFHAPYRPLIASLGHTGQVDEAREYLAGLQRLEPDFSIDWFRTNYPPLHEDYSERYIQGLRKAGVPEE